MFPAELTKVKVCLLGSALSRDTDVLLVVYRVPWDLHFLCFLLVILRFKMALRHSAEVLPGAPHARSLGCASGRKHMFKSSLQAEFNVTESTASIK